MNNKRKPIVERFWAKVDKSGDCWLWTASVNTHGYGHLGEGGKDGRTVAAHRVSYELAYGPIPDGLDVLHKCDNPPCVRPEHLFLGTQTDNLTDMVTKGRRLYSSKAGELNTNAVLKRNDVDRIRELFAQGQLRSELAAEYNMSWSAINRIVQGESWNP